MPSEIAQGVKAAIKNFVALRTANGDIEIDVLRTIRDEATLLMERQAIFDAFDCDSLRFYDGDMDLKEQVERLKRIMSVISCSRCATKDGYSSIEAVVEIAKDPLMTNIQEGLRLTFRFQREKIYSEKESGEDKMGLLKRSTSRSLDKKQKSPTHVTYDIDFSKDHGGNKRLLTVEVFAKRDYPSVEPAQPMDDNESMVDADDAEILESPAKENNVESISVEDSEADRYAAFADPDAMQEFLVCANLDFAAENALFFLMTFPFYEHEWDIFGFLLDCVFGEDEDSDEFEDMTDSDGSDDL